MRQATNANAITSLFSVKEFSEISGVRQSTLRYWDEMGLFPPARRNEKTGYRYYSPDQIMVVDILKTLNSLNLPLKGMADACKKPAPKRVLALLWACNAQVEQKIAELRARQEVLQSHAAQIEEGRAVQPG